MGSRDISVSVTGTASPIVDNNPQRKALIITHTSGVDGVAISPSPSVTTSTGIRLLPGNDQRPLILTGEDMRGIVTGRLFAVSSGGTVTLGIIEVT